MGRPIKSKFIKTTSPKYITCTAWPVGASGAVACTIVNQQSSNSYKVVDNASHASRCKLVNSASPTVGQMSITVQQEVNPTTAAIFSVNMAASHAASVAVGTGYTTSFTATVVGGTGTAATLTVTVTADVITAVTVLSGGSYSALPTNPVTITGGSGTGATFNLTYGVLNFSDSGHIGAGYGPNTTVEFVGGGYTTQATGTVTVSSGTLTAPTITAAGTGYTSIPTVVAISQGAIEYVSKLNNRTVNTFQDHRYIWEFATSGHTNSGSPGDLSYAVIQGNVGS
jgi:hypothetical protein